MDTINTDGPQSVDDALAEIKKWKEEGKTEDAINGCKEILEIDPQNAEAKSLLAEMKGAMETPATEEPVATEQEIKIAPAMENTPAQTPEVEKSAEEAIPEETETPVETPIEPKVPTVEPAEEQTPTEKTPAETPVETPEVEKPAEEITAKTNPAENPLYSIDTPAKPKSTDAPMTPKKKDSHGIVLNLLMLLIAAVVIGGGIYVYLTYFQSSDVEEPKVLDEVVVEKTTEEETITEEEPVIEEETEVSANEQRLEDLAYIETELKNYYEENRMYPNAEDLATEIGNLPHDPVNEGELTYVYAVYDNNLGKNQDYILSAGFEEETSEITVWTTGASPQDHTDYRDTDLEHVTYIGINQAQPEVEDVEEAIEEVVEETTEKVKRK